MKRKLEPEWTTSTQEELQQEKELSQVATSKQVANSIRNSQTKTYAET